jgi:GNAT superfamily N-acetyltransferase
MALPASFPPDVQVRPAALDDLEAVFEVMQTQEMAEYGESDLSLDELRASWQVQLPSMWVVLAPEGHLVACGEIKTTLSGTTVMPLVRVLPTYQGRGIGTALLHLLESQAAECRAAAGLEAPQRFLTRVSGRNTAAHRVLEKNGYTRHSAFQMMELKMTEPPPGPPVIEGIEVRLFVVGRDERAVYEADEEAFLDERGKTPRTFEVWSRRLDMGTPRFDPTFWYVAWDGDQIAGTSMSEVVEEQRGEMMHLGVRRPWRRRGLGLALLLHTLGELYRRDIHTIRLNVDSQSLTNAHLLYARAGFQVINSYWHYEKSFPPCE